MPFAESAAGIVQVFAGTLDGTTSPAPHYSDLLGADLQVYPRHTLVVPLNPAYEHAILVMNGDCALDDQSLDERVLYYLGTTRSEAGFSSRQWRSGAAHRRTTISRDDPHVVELCGADS